MNTIMICGDCGERILTKTIVRSCSHYGNVMTINGGSVNCLSGHPDFLIISMNAVCDIDCEGILVFGEALCQVPETVCIKKVCAVTDQENTDALSVIRQSGIPAVGCSMSGKASVSLSCFNGMSGLLSVQRKLLTIGKRVIEPCEIRLTANNPIEVYSALAAGCILLLCDIPYTTGYILS